MRSSKVPDTRVRARSTPPEATPEGCCHSRCCSPLSHTLICTVRIQEHWHRLDTCLHCPDVEHTAQTGHLITPSGYRTHNTCRTFIYTVRIQNTRHRPDTYSHCPDTRTQSTHQKFNDTVQIREHRAQAGHLLTRSTTYTNMWIGRTLTDTVHGMHKQHITPVS